MFKVNPNSKSYRIKNAAARANAHRSAACHITYGNGGLAEAIEAYKWFCEGFPSLKKYIGRIEWIRVYRAHPQWVHIRAWEARHATTRAANG